MIKKTDEVYNSTYRDIVNQLLDIKETINMRCISNEEDPTENYQLRIADENLTAVLDAICRAEELVRDKHYDRLKKSVSAMLDYNGTIGDADVIRNEIKLLESLVN